MTPAEALAAIDKIEQSVDRIRNLDVGLKSALVADFDRLREFAVPAKVADVIEVYSRPECVFMYCSAPSLCKGRDRCVNG